MSLRDTDTLSIQAAGNAVWRLKFWNYDIDRRLLMMVNRELLGIGFPLASVRSLKGVPAVLNWLSNKANRRRAVNAYRKAFGDFRANVRRGRVGHMSNLISLALFSGPDGSLKKWAYCYKREGFWTHCKEGRNLNVGWLGTGDALLGVSEIWKDFQRHYRSELGQVGAYLVPHHGAGASNGYAYYNKGLNHAPCVRSIFSYGTYNTYGHPNPVVKSEVSASCGISVFVNEKRSSHFVEGFLLA